MRCWVKSRNERNPYFQLLTGKAEDSGEDETAWMNQGRANLIMDNMIAEGKCEPFIIVCTYGLRKTSAESPESST